MKPEKLKSLQQYEQRLRDRISSPVPAKHAHRPEQFKAMLRKDLELTQKTIADAKLGAGGDKGTAAK